MPSAPPIYLGIDVGGTRMTGALVDRAGRALHVERRSTDRQAGAQAGIATICGIAAALIGKARLDGAAVKAIGVGFGGPVDSRAGIVRMSHHVAGWDNLPLAKKLGDAFGLPVRLDNDCNAGALGEWRFGAGRGASDVLYINIGTGIGGGVICGGRLVAGACNGAGEIGHMTIEPEGPVCTCGRRGCLEALASGSGIGARARERGLGESATSKDVFALAAEGHALAREIVAETADHLARAIGTAAALTNPEIVILGGGVAEVGEMLLAPIRERLPHYALPFHVDSLKAVHAKLGYDAGVLGAAALAMPNERD